MPVLSDSDSEYEASSSEDESNHHNDAEDESDSEDGYQPPSRTVAKAEKKRRGKAMLIFSVLFIFSKLAFELGPRRHIVWAVVRFLLFALQFLLVSDCVPDGSKWVSLSYMAWRFRAWKIFTLLKLDARRLIMFSTRVCVAAKHLIRCEMMLKTEWWLPDILANSMWLFFFVLFMHATINTAIICIKEALDHILRTLQDPARRNSMARRVMRARGRLQMRYDKFAPTPGEFDFDPSS